jgi:signal transduction histidine kinase
MPADSTTERLAAEVNAVENAVSDVIHQLRRHSREGIRSTTDLVAVARERLAFWAALAGQQGRPCTIEVGPGTEMVALARDDAATLVDVLLNNVFAHTPDRTPFKVAIDHVAEDQVRLVVEDQGPGFPAAMTARGASGTGSTGLGLDIARRVADAVGGSLTTSTSPEGGARVEVVMKTV